MIRYAYSIALCLALALTACGPAEPPRPAGPPTPMERQLTDTPNTERDADWSPDGQWIVFGSSAAGNEDLYLIPSAGGPIEQLTSGPSDDLYAAWSPVDDRILFTSNRGGGSDNVWTISPDGNDLRQVTQSSDLVVNRRNHLASWTPDGQSILYASARGRERPGIWQIPADGGTAALLSPGRTEHETSPSMSPDGTQIAFDQFGFDERDVYVRDLQTGETRVLVSNSGIDWAPDWSPDGRWIAFSSWRGGTVELWVVPAMGGESFNVTNSPGRHEFVPRWSPDSRQLVFNTVPQEVVRQLVPTDGSTPRVLSVPDSLSQPRWGRDDDELILRNRAGFLWTYSVATGDTVRLSHARMDSTSPFFDATTSPDGRYLAYIDTDSADDQQFYLLSLQTGRVRQITASRFSRRVGIAWSPDSRTLAFGAVSIEGIVDVWTVPANGGTETRLTDGRGESFEPSWSPDGERLAYTRADSSGYRIFTMATDGTDHRFLVTGNRPVWSQDDWIYYNPQSGFTASDILRVRPTGGEPQLVHVISGAFSGFDLSPSGALVLVNSRDPGNLFISDVGALLDFHSARASR